ncbi:hypothetical protein HELRODRAFT_160565 [Helobdella robusta]|uniref:JmjC domain-containing protein n=1 Tax=Helobdella robusta TaxID=6412 RepID=T1EQF3_HELRO|nr:hypothetical protein HELRODRAFT_160565 [Helobdella robusta]ESO06395.1 hypothetical protein HELRODRAFT_160565 [Helobdella robusta]
MKIDDIVTISDPGKEEFSDFSNFLNGITQDGKICIIHPPKEWRPTFVINGFENLFSKNNFDKNCRVWNIYDYGIMADDFKRDFFEKPVDKVPEDAVETEFWNLMHRNRRLMCSDHTGNSMISNQAGAHKKKSKITTINMVGLSGFPTDSCKDLYEQDKMYLNSPWNLSNTKDHCLLKYISSSSFSKGLIESSLQMCFSHRPWTRNEINAWTLHYLHWGDSRTWYCAIFDEAADSDQGRGGEKMKDLIGVAGGCTCPLIDDITALQNVKTVKFFQRAGEYVFIPPHVHTFSISHGFNFSESSLYLPDNWIQQTFKLYEEQLLDGCTFKEAIPFSFEEMLVRMANQQQMLTSTNVETVYNILSRIIDNHLKYCDEAQNTGLPIKIVHKNIELVNENVRRCFVCGSVAFLAVVKCNVCKKVTCLKHFTTKNDHETCQQQQRKQKEHHQLQRHEQQQQLHGQPHQRDDLQDIQPFITSYLKYTPVQLASILNALKERVESHKKWLQTADQLLHSVTNIKIFSSYAELIAFKNKYYELNIKNDVLVMGVKILINSVKKLVKNANSALLGGCPKLSLDGLKTLYNDLINSPCQLEVTDKIRKNIEIVEDFNAAMDQLLSSSSLPLTMLPANKTFETKSTPTTLKRKFLFNRSDLNYLMDVSKSLLVEHSYSDILNKMYEQVLWIEGSENVIKSLSLSESALSSSSSSSSSSTLSAFLSLTSSRHWIDNNDLKQVKSLIREGLRPNLGLKEMKELLKLAEDHPSEVKSDKLIKWKNKISMAEQWEQEFEQLLSNDNSPYLHDMQQHLEKSAELPVSSEILTQLENDICKAVDWLKKAEDLFVVQRGDADQIAFVDASFIGGCKSGSSLFETKCIREAERKELEDMLVLRTVNKLKWISNDSLYCFCKQPLSLDMIQCFLCCNYFHISCQQNNQIASTISSNAVTTNKREAVETSAQPTSVYSSSSTSNTVFQSRYYCINCCHSKRPALDDVYQLLVILLLVPLRIIEGQLLEMLVDRVSSWMNRLKEYLQSDECRPAISHLLSFEETITQLERCELFVKDADIQRVCRLKNFIESSSPAFERLDKFVVEGELLEVSTDEHDYVWRFMSLYYRSKKLIDDFVKCAEQAKRLKSIDQSVEDENFGTKIPTQTDGLIITSAAKAPDIKPSGQHKRDANIETSSNSTTKKCKLTLKDYKANSCNDDLELASNNDYDKDDDEMVKEEEEDEEEDQDIMSECDESNDSSHEDCSVGSCLRPLGLIKNI